MSVLFQHLRGDHIEWDRFQSGKQAPMSYNPAKGFPRIMPSLWYEDVGEALAWLSHVGGFKEHLR